MSGPKSADVQQVELRVHAPGAASVELVELSDDATIPRARRPLRRADRGRWVGTVTAGTVYGLLARGGGRDDGKQLVDPAAAAVRIPPTHSRRLATTVGADNVGRAPAAIARAPRAPLPQRRTSRPPFVYELHVVGMTRTRERSDAGTFGALVDELDRLAALGVSVVELMPVHAVDPLEGSYWGYMPMVFGAIAGHLAAGDDPADELAALVAAAHARDIEVWLDVVFNHTTEVGRDGPTYNLRGLDEAGYYRVDECGDYTVTTGCGNDLDVTDPAASELVIDALSRFADLGVDGFRFDLAPVLARGDFIARLDDWAGQRGVRLIAEPWDAVGGHMLGRAWPSDRWAHWNDRYRDDMRSYLRGDEGFVPAVMQRVQGSPDLVDAPLQSINFFSCHDGFTLYDIVAFDHKHNRANGHDNGDGASDNRSWNCGWEGDVGVPDEVLALRRRQLRNAWALLAMSHGVPMATMGDELGRTQNGNNNPYNQDNATSWVDWQRSAHFIDLEAFVGELLALRARHPLLSQPEWWGEALSFFGVEAVPDTSHHSRSLGWAVGDLCICTNMWVEPLAFTLPAGTWRPVIDTAEPDGLPAVRGTITGGLAAAHVAGRSVRVFERTMPNGGLNLAGQQTSAAHRTDVVAPVRQTLGMNVPPPADDQVQPADAAAPTTSAGEVDTIVGIAFEDAFRAQEFLTAATRLATKHQIVMRDAVIISKDADGRARVQETRDPSPGTSALSGGMWSGLLGLLLAGPVGLLVGGAVGAGTGAVTAKLIDIGVPDEWVAWFRDAVPPGTVSVVLLLGAFDQRAVIDELERFAGARLVYANVDAAAVARIRGALDDPSTGPLSGIEAEAEAVE